MSTSSPKRKSVNKKASAKAFNRASKRTNHKNTASKPMRGGWRS